MSASARFNFRDFPGTGIGKVSLPLRIRDNNNKFRGAAVSVFGEYSQFRRVRDTVFLVVTRDDYYDTRSDINT